MLFRSGVTLYRNNGYANQYATRGYDDTAAKKTFSVHGNNNTLFAAFGIEDSSTNTPRTYFSNYVDSGIFSFRIGATPVVVLNLSASAISPESDNSMSCGETSNRWSEVHSRNGVVVTTPNGSNKYRIAVDNSGNVTATII